MSTKNRKKVGLLLLAVLIEVVLASFIAAGFGVTPGDKTVTFSPAKSYDFTFSLINNEDVDLDVELSSVGEYKDLLFLSSQKVSLKKGSYLTPFDVALRLPQEMEPGVRTASVKVTPIIPDSEDMFKAFVSIIIPVHIRVPYPEKYVKVDIRVTPVDEGTPVPINLEFDNLGTEDVMRAGGTIKVFFPDGSVANTLSVGEISVPKNTFGKSEGRPLLPLRNGVYTAEANAYYDGEEVAVSKNFSIGKPKVTVSEVSSELAVGQVSPVSFKAASDWNVDLEVRGFVVIDGLESEIPVFTLKPGVEKEISSFYDATLIQPGDKEIIIRLAFAGTVKDYKFNLAARQAGGISESIGGNRMVLILLSSVVLLILLILVVLWIVGRNKGGGQLPQVPPSQPPAQPPQQQYSPEVQQPQLPPAQEYQPQTVQRHPEFFKPQNPQEPPNRPPNEGNL